MSASHDQFAGLHSSDEPLVLFNIWDAGSAQAVARAGAKAIATGSLSLAGAQGFDDGEAIPFEQLLVTVRQIARAVDVPLTVDFETGFVSDFAGLTQNAELLRAAGAVGCNLEDRLIGTDALREIADQSARITAVAGAGLFVNARTDTFLGPLMAGRDPNQPELVKAAIERGKAYANAGAGCFFIPGLSDPDMIAEIVAGVPIPVNVMRLPNMISNAELGALGVSRISYGPGPWRDAMSAVEQSAREALGA